MSAADISPHLPPLASVAAALRLTTEHLAAELADPKPAAPEWSEFEWGAARAVAAMHGISALLAEKLLWRGPQEWSGFLSRQREHIARRQLRLQGLLGAVADQCLQAGIPVQALKGSALHGAGLYGPAQRPMADLDLLTAPRHIAQLTKILEGLGLRESRRTFKHRIFEPRDATR
ncbi:MAG TPA: nucleotidyltransferase family protein, partial [Steroidobacteraceae bacterium]